MTTYEERDLPPFPENPTNEDYERYGKLVKSESTQPSVQDFIDFLNKEQPQPSPYADIDISWFTEDDLCWNGLNENIREAYPTYFTRNGENVFLEIAKAFMRDKPNWVFYMKEYYTWFTWGRLDHLLLKNIEPHRSEEDIEKFTFLFDGMLDNYIRDYCKQNNIKILKIHAMDFKHIFTTLLQVALNKQILKYGKGI